MSSSNFSARSLFEYCETQYSLSRPAITREDFSGFARHFENLSYDSFKISQTSVSQWRTLVDQSEAGSHPWYDFLESAAPMSTFAPFLEEEILMPAFVPLLRGVAKAFPYPQVEDAVSQNISDETKPGEVHSQLFEHLMQRVRSRIHAQPILDTVFYETNLAYYYGHFIDPLFQLGALYATECMVPRRAGKIFSGLRRHGFEGEDLRFMSIHSTVDEKHSQDWVEEIIIPLIGMNEVNRGSISAGIAVRLYTSAAYLDRLYANAQAILPSGIGFETVNRAGVVL